MSPRMTPLTRSRNVHARRSGWFRDILIFDHAPLHFDRAPGMRVQHLDSVHARRRSPAHRRRRQARAALHDAGCVGREDAAAARARAPRLQHRRARADDLLQPGTAREREADHARRAGRPHRQRGRAILERGRHMLRFRSPRRRRRRVLDRDRESDRDGISARYEARVRHRALERRSDGAAPRV